MSKFAEYEPNRRRIGDVSFTVRLASPSDAQSIGAISVARDGGVLEDHIEGATREIEQQNVKPPRRAVFVAESDIGVVGFARIGYRVPPVSAPSECIPEGWYLTGIVVTPAYRRYGIGLRLTEHRIQWVAAHAKVVRYFSNVKNRAAIAMHEKLGFKEVRRGIWAPGVEFQNAAGALFELSTDDVPIVYGPEAEA